MKEILIKMKAKKALSIILIYMIIFLFISFMHKFTYHGLKNKSKDAKNGISKLNFDKYNVYSIDLFSIKCHNDWVLSAYSDKKGYGFKQFIRLRRESVNYVREITITYTDLNPSYTKSDFENTSISHIDNNNHDYTIYLTKHSKNSEFLCVKDRKGLICNLNYPIDVEKFSREFQLDF